MKKYFIYFLMLFISTLAVAQKNITKPPEMQLLLMKGQQINISTTSTMDAEMGMGMNIKNDLVQSNTFIVKEVTDKAYTVTSTLNRMQLSGNMMGKEVSFDSDKKEDLENEIGKSIKDKIGKTITATIDRSTGKLILQPTETIDTPMDNNPLGSMFGSTMGNEEDNISSVFFIIPAGKKPGDSWTDSSSAEKMKSVIEYKYLSLDKEAAIISINTITSGTNTVDANGMQIDIVMKSTSTGQIKVNTKTSLVQKRNATADINGNMDMMGQSMEISSKASSTTEYK